MSVARGTMTDQHSDLKGKTDNPVQIHVQCTRPATGTWLKCWLTSRDNELSELRRESYKTARTQRHRQIQKSTCTPPLRAGSSLPRSFVTPLGSAWLDGGNAS